MGVKRALIREYIEEFKAKTNPRPKFVPKMVRIPIVWFGDSQAYFSKDNSRRIVTVGLNPSFHEFTQKRFGPVDLEAEDAEERLSAALDGYFRKGGNAYWQWFGKYRKMLANMGCSYEEGGCRALHVDLFSAIATQPTWSGLVRELGKKKTKAFADTALFGRLLEELKPKVIVFSGSNQVLEDEFGDFREVPGKQFHDEAGRAYLKLLKRDDGTRLLFGTNTRSGPFGKFGDDLLAGKIKEWGLGR